MHLHKLCYGYYKKTVQYASLIYNISFILDQTPPAGDISWDIERNAKIPKDVCNEESIGTIRSLKCPRATHKDNYICTECEQVPQIMTFRQRVLRKSENKKVASSTVNNRYLSQEQLHTKLKSYKQDKDHQRKTQYYMRQNLQGVEKKLKSLSDVIKEQSSRGDVSAICSNLNKAYENGQLTDKTNTVKFLKTIASNMIHKPQGRRYDSFTKDLYEAIRIVGGPRSAAIMADNLSGPSDGTLKQYHRKGIMDVSTGQCDTLMTNIAKVYQELMVNHGISYPVLAEQAEDETAIVKMLQWMPRKDIIVGSCGSKSPDHMCLPNYVHHVGHETDSFMKLKEFFDSSVVASMARIIMINPLHKLLPAAVIHLMPTCNTFDFKFVLNQWQWVDDTYKRLLYPVLGPKVGNASDGDARRRKAMLLLAQSKEGERYGLSSPGFTLTGKLNRVNGEVFSINIMNQDYPHNIKKIINPLDHTSRNLMLGGHVVHMNHLLLVTQKFELQVHGMRHEDIVREDRQNYASAQRLLFPRVQDCLQQIEHGYNGPPQDVLGTRLYLYIGYLYMEVFCSLSASLLDRVQYASTVIHFLQIWRRWIFKHPLFHVSKNFISREAFQDVVLSCHAAVLHIMATRDFTPQHPVNLSKIGSDCCEDYFSQNGQFVLNKHTYSFGDMLTNLSNLNRLLQIQASPNAPHIKKRHEKQENIWHKGTETPPENPDMRDFPTDIQLLVDARWRIGNAQAQQLCIKLGESGFLSKHSGIAQFLTM